MRGTSDTLNTLCEIIKNSFFSFNKNSIGANLFFLKPMLGIVDILAITLKNNSERVNDSLKRIFVEQDGDLTWICFLPWRTDLKTAQRYNLLPKEGNLIVYEVPDNLLGAIPQLTLDAFDSIKQDFEAVFIECELSNKNIAFWGLSAGTLPAFYFANKCACKKLVAVCPTARLGEGIFSAFAARNIRKKSIENGYTAELYDGLINDINIENNLPNLPDDVTIHIARFDKFVPFSGGKKLVLRIKDIKRGAVIKKHNIFGHILTLYSFGRENKKINLPQLNLTIRKKNFLLHHITRHIWFKNFALYNKSRKAKFPLPNCADDN